MWDREKRSTYKWSLINRLYEALKDFSACLGVAGIPLLRAFSLSPILSIQVPQLNRFPPYTKPVSGFTLATILKPEKVHKKKKWIHQFFQRNKKTNKQKNNYFKRLYLHLSCCGQSVVRRSSLWTLYPACGAPWLHEWPHTTADPVASPKQNNTGDIWITVKPKFTMHEIVYFLKRNEYFYSATKLYRIVMGNIVTIMRKNGYAWAFCPFLGLHLVTSCPVYGSFICLWSVLCSYFIWTASEFIGSGPRSIFSAASVRLFGAHQG